VLFKYNLRPKFYVFNKNDIYQRDIYFPAVKTIQKSIVLKKEAKTANPILKDLIKIKRYIKNPNYALSLKPNKKGGFHVALNEIKL
jgi:predicted Zn-ribbon and HTH transcriptional regulator